MGTETRKDYHTAMMQYAQEAFKNHKISRQISERHWVIQQPYKDGHPGWDSMYAAEIIVTVCGRIVVTGDIGPMLFGYYSLPDSNPEGAIHWMGRQGKVDSYVCEKAHIGMGEDIKEWNADVARVDLTDIYDQRVEDLKENVRETVAANIDDEIADGELSVDPKLRDAMIERKVPHEHAIAIDNDEVAQACLEGKRYAHDGPMVALEKLYNCDDGCELASDVGMVPKPAVYYTWAALERLSQLLLEKTNETTEEGTCQTKE